MTVVAMVAIAGAVAWFALRPSGDDGSDVAKPPGSGALTRADRGRSPARPMLDPATHGTGDKTPAQIYDSEVRDDAWATPTEAEIRRRFAAIRGAKLEATDCRETRCAITVAGSAGDVGKTIADLESERGLHGYAESVLLTPPEQRTDGTVVLRAIASFRR